MSLTKNKLQAVGGQFKKYFLAAGVGYLFDISILYMLHDVFNVHYLLAAALSFINGLVVVYLLSSRYVFSNSKLTSKSAEIGIFTLIGVVGLGILSTLMWLLTGILGINYLIAKILATVIVYLWNFFARRALYYND